MHSTKLVKKIEEILKRYIGDVTRYMTTGKRVINSIATKIGLLFLNQSILTYLTKQKKIVVFSTIIFV